MDVLVTCKYEEDPIKNEGARVDTVTTEWSGAADTICQDGTAHNGIKINENCLLQTNFISLNTDSKHLTSLLQLHFILLAFNSCSTTPRRTLK